MTNPKELYTLPEMRETLRNIFRRPVVIYPVLFAVFPILFLYAHNVEQMITGDIGVILIPIVVAICAALLSWLLLSFILKDKRKAALVVSIGLIMFFSYGHLAPLLEGIWKTLPTGNFVTTYNKFFLTVWGILFLIGAYFAIRTRRNLNTLTSLLNVFSVALVLISLINIGAYIFRAGLTPLDNKNVEIKEDSISPVETLQAPPDIYYIILDGYARQDTLKEVYGYDNSDFIDYLTDKGFFVASESHTNYAASFLSLASSLNMEHVNHLANIVGVESRDTKVACQMIQDSKVMNFLKSRGYKFINFRSGWGPTDHNRFADLEIFGSGLNEFHDVLIQKTMAGPFMYYFLQDTRRQRVLHTFSQLPEMDTLAAPKFVFAHIVSPHPPYVFDVKGEPVPEAKLEMTGHVWEQKELYLNQLIFINKKVEVLVGEILSRSEVPPIIILQADHGTASSFYSGSGGWDHPTKDMLRERFSIFNAYYLPQGGNSLLYDSITPVNTFRLIFNFYFGTEHEFLGDRCYYSTYKHPYSFIDVTDKVGEDLETE